MVIRNYELMFIANPELDEERAEALLQRVRGYLEEMRGAIVKFDDWGVRRMAYTIQNFREGHYYLVYFTMDTDQVKEFERRLLLVEGVIREIIIRLEEEVVLPEAEVEVETQTEAEVEPAVEEPAPTATETVEVETQTEAKVESAVEEPTPTAAEAVEVESQTEAEAEPATEEPTPTATEAVESGDAETPATESD
ncbi:MAG: 30S ribosomal protein S6 [Chloroflexota bacterium]|nr:30S ribosomal protein S6 [Chloroflexota bacterium]